VSLRRFNASVGAWQAPDQRDADTGIGAEEVFLAAIATQRYLDIRTDSPRANHVALTVRGRAHEEWEEGIDGQSDSLLIKLTVSQWLTDPGSSGHASGGSERS
jgi:hypothetical protein